MLNYFNSHSLLEELNMICGWIINSRVREPYGISNIEELSEILLQIIREEPITLHNDFSLFKLHLEEQLKALKYYLRYILEYDILWDECPHRHYLFPQQFLDISRDNPYYISEYIQKLNMFWGFPKFKKILYRMYSISISHRPITTVTGYQLGLGYDISVNILSFITPTLLVVTNNITGNKLFFQISRDGKFIPKSFYCKDTNNTFYTENDDEKRIMWDFLRNITKITKEIDSIS